MDEWFKAGEGKLLDDDALVDLFAEGLQLLEQGMTHGRYTPAQHWAFAARAAKTKRRLAELRALQSEPAQLAPEQAGAVKSVQAATVKGVGSLPAQESAIRQRVQLGMMQPEPPSQSPRRPASAPAQSARPPRRQNHRKATVQRAETARLAARGPPAGTGLWTGTAMISWPASPPSSPDGKREEPQEPAQPQRPQSVASSRPASVASVRVLTAPRATALGTGETVHANLLWRGAYGMRRYPGTAL